MPDKYILFTMNDSIIDTWHQRVEKTLYFIDETSGKWHDYPDWDCGGHKLSGAESIEKLAQRLAWIASSDMRTHMKISVQQSLDSGNILAAEKSIDPYTRKTRYPVTPAELEEFLSLYPSMLEKAEARRRQPNPFACVEGPPCTRMYKR